MRTRETGKEPSLLARCEARERGDDLVAHRERVVGPAQWLEARVDGRDAETFVNLNAGRRALSRDERERALLRATRLEVQKGGGITATAADAVRAPKGREE